MSGGGGFRIVSGGGALRIVSGGGALRIVSGGGGFRICLKQREDLGLSEKGEGFRIRVRKGKI